MGFLVFSIAIREAVGRWMRVMMLVVLLVWSFRAEYYQAYMAVAAQMGLEVKSKVRKDS